MIQVPKDNPDNVKNCPKCKKYIRRESRPINHKPVPCPHCQTLIFLDYDEEESEGDYRWVYWFSVFK